MVLISPTSTLTSVNGDVEFACDALEPAAGVSSPSSAERYRLGERRVLRRDPRLRREDDRRDLREERDLRLREERDLRLREERDLRLREDERRDLRLRPLYDVSSSSTKVCSGSGTTVMSVGCILTVVKKKSSSDTCNERPSQKEVSQSVPNKQPNVSRKASCVSYGLGGQESASRCGPNGRLPQQKCGRVGGGTDVLLGRDAPPLFRHDLRGGRGQKFQGTQKESGG